VHEPARNASKLFCMAGRGNTGKANDKLSRALSKYKNYDFLAGFFAVFAAVFLAGFLAADLAVGLVAFLAAGFFTTGLTFSFLGKASFNFAN